VTNAPTTYTHGHHDSVLRSHRWRTAGNSAAYLIDQLWPGRALLDIGCGAGTITADLAALVSPGKTIAIDSSSAAVKETRKVSVDRALRNVKFSVTDVQKPLSLTIHSTLFTRIRCCSTCPIPSAR
jgi:ubiquinone/menaquinone biosynthesis C-methylase UbiE